MTRVYKILSRGEWEAARAAGALTGSALDRKDGYIHLSTAEQAAETARLHFRGQADLVLLACDSAPLGDALRLEPSRGGQLFPHLYADLPTAAVVEVQPLALDEDGVPQVGPLRA